MASEQRLTCGYGCVGVCGTSSPLLNVHALCSPTCRYRYLSHVLQPNIEGLQRGQRRQQPCNTALGDLHAQRCGGEVCEAVQRGEVQKPLVRQLVLGAPGEDVKVWVRWRVWDRVHVWTREA